MKWPLIRRASTAGSMAPPQRYVPGGMESARQVPPQRAEPRVRTDRDRARDKRAKQSRKRNRRNR